jgi:Holliday junction DNA helicase RuvA
MDVETRRDFWQTMHKTRRTVLFATHYLDEAEQFADRVVLMREGRVIADGSVADIRAHVTGRRLTAVVDHPDRDALAALPGVTEVGIRGGAITLGCADSDQAVRALLATDPSQARRRRRRHRPGDLPHLARRHQGQTRPERPQAEQNGSTTVIASVRGQVLALAPDAAVVEVGGVGYSVRATPGTLAGLAVGSESTLHTSLVVREDSLTLYGFADADERDLFELLQTASGVGPRLAQAMLAVHSPDVLRAAVAGGDEKALTAVPGIGKKGAQKLLIELKDRLGAPTGTARVGARVGAPVSASWRDQLHAALIGLGYATREADEAVTAVTPQAEAAEGTPQVGQLLKAALQTLNRAR